MPRPTPLPRRQECTRNSLDRVVFRAPEVPSSRPAQPYRFPLRMPCRGSAVGAPEHGLHEERWSAGSVVGASRYRSGARWVAGLNVSQLASQRCITGVPCPALSVQATPMGAREKLSRKCFFWCHTFLSKKLVVDCTFTSAQRDTQRDSKQITLLSLWLPEQHPVSFRRSLGTSRADHPEISHE